MPSIIEQITQKQPETYVDGYGTVREVYEPKIIKFGRNVYQKLGDFFNGPDEIVLPDETKARVQRDNLGILGLVSPGGIAKNLIQYSRPVTGLKSFQLEKPIASVTNDINELGALTSELANIEKESQSLRLPLPSYYKSKNARANQLAKSLTAAEEHLTPFVSSGELKKMFQQKDYRRIVDLLGNSNSQTLWDVRKEFYAEYSRLKTQMSAKQAWEQAGQAMRRELLRLFGY